jgi:hypothetical protein
MLDNKLIRRMESAKSNRGYVNCIGTILFVLGVIEEDSYVGNGEKRWESGIVDDLLNKMEKIDQPKEGAILVIRDYRVEHMGIIVNTEPPRVYHRPGIYAKVESDVPLDNVISRYSEFPKREFYVKKTASVENVFTANL